MEANFLIKTRQVIDLVEKVDFSVLIKAYYTAWCNIVYFFSVYLFLFRFFAVSPPHTERNESLKIIALCTGLLFLAYRDFSGFS